MKPIEVDLSGISTLGELFAVWQETQEQHGSNEQKFAKSVKKSTFPDCKCSSGHASGYHPDFHKSFCYDGFITDRQEGRKTILFICREANLGSDKICQENKTLLPQLSDLFWVKSQLEEGKENPYTTFVNSIANKCKELNKEDYNLAYMNLNKRGGFGECNMARVGHYVKLYQSFICKEIELIGPDIIICGGTFDTVKGLILAGHFKLLKDMGKEEIICRDFYHPASRQGVYEKKSLAKISLPK